MSNIVVPVLGESIVEARIAKWLKKPGDHVEIGDPLVELETEKTNLELSAEKRGVITSIARKEGEDVKIGELLAVVDENGAGATPAAGGNGASKSAKPAPTSDSPIAPTSNKIAPTTEAKIAPASNGIAPTREAKIAPTREAKIAPTRVGTARQESLG